MTNKSALERERRVILMALRHVLQCKDDQGVSDVTEHIKIREHELTGIRSDIRVEVEKEIGRSEIVVAPWVGVMGGDDAPEFPGL